MCGLGLGDAGAQPMVDEDLRLVTVFSGCIYNHHELRAELRRAPAGSGSPPSPEIASWAARRARTPARPARPAAELMILAGHS